MNSNENKKPATIHDVAARAGVSISMVSRVINKSAPVSKDKAQKILEAIDELNYRPKAAARKLASRKTELAGLLLPIINSEYFASVLQGAEKGLIEDGFGLLIHSTWLEIKHDMPFKNVLAEHNTDGLIILSNSVDEKELRRLYRIQFPMVLLHQRSPEGLNIPCVILENENGAYQLVEHLITVHNRRKIVYLRGLDGHEDSYWREMGYKKALADYGIPFDPSLVGVGNFYSEDSRDSIKKMLEDKIEFDAIFAGDDGSASGVLMALRETNIRVPEDVSVVGFDNLNLALHMVPPLTTVDAQVEKAAYLAAKQLAILIKTKKADPVTYLSTNIVIRNSCGCSK
jgi:DNA-binding LacI/PurR family transcriptional regulator